MTGQTPERSEVFLDHVGWFVPDMDAAAAVLDRLGFTLTDCSVQTVPGADGVPVPAGGANRCAMLARGYLEVLTPIGETPTAERMRTAIARRTGLHLAALSVADAERETARLAAVGIPVQPTVHLARETPVGRVRFSVVRPDPATMAEGRIQMLTHHDPDTLWRTGSTTHPNQVTALDAVVIAVEDLDAATLRYARFLGRPGAMAAEGRVRFDLDRGQLHLVDPSATAALGLPPVAPGVAAAVLRAPVEITGVGGWRRLNPGAALGGDIVLQSVPDLWLPK